MYFLHVWFHLNDCLFEHSYLFLTKSLLITIGFCFLHVMTSQYSSWKTRSSKYNYDINLLPPSYSVSTSFCAIRSTLSLVVILGLLSKTLSQHSSILLSIPLVSDGFSSDNYESLFSVEKTISFFRIFQILQLFTSFKHLLKKYIFLP